MHFQRGHANPTPQQSDCLPDTAYMSRQFGKIADLSNTVL